MLAQRCHALSHNEVEDPRLKEHTKGIHSDGKPIQTTTLFHPLGGFYSKAGERGLPVGRAVHERPPLGSSPASCACGHACRETGRPQRPLAGAYVRTWLHVTQAATWKGAPPDILRAFSTLLHLPQSHGLPSVCPVSSFTPKSAPSRSQHSPLGLNTKEDNFPLS